MNLIKELEDNHGPGCYPYRGIVLSEGYGAVVKDDTGKTYIDCAAGQGVANIGHCNKMVVDAVKQQAEKLITCTGSFYTEPRSLLLEKLVSITPEKLNNVFLCNSGAEAVEAAMKLARLVSSKTEFIAAMRSFHGRTFGALSATHNIKYKQDFQPLVPGFTHVPFNKFEKLQDAVNENTAAIILEIVQGEGGVNIGQPEYFQAVRRLCDEQNIILIIDEVQTGFCRTGKMFAFEHAGIVPDILCMAKAMGGGLPVGAIMFPEKYKMDPGKHGSTFGGSPLPCATAVAAIEFMQENDLAGQAEKKGAYLIDKLNTIKSEKIRKVRGLGLMIGIELKEKVQPHISALMELGILALPAGPTVLRLLPPLVIEYEQLDCTVKMIEKVLTS